MGASAETGTQIPAGAPTQGRDSPDTAVIVAGGTGRTLALRSGEPAFARLSELLQPTYTGTERVPEEWTEGRYPPVNFTVIWGLSGVGGWPQTSRAPGGDVAVERQDQLFVATDGSPWVRSDLAPDVEDDDIRWHRAPRSVFVRLEQQGVLDGLGDGPRDGVDAAGGAGEGAAGSGSAQTGSTASDRAASADRLGAGGLGRGGIWWTLPGLAVGLTVGGAGALLIRRAAARHGAGPPREEPRHELIDLDM
ncbi:hypothetical protein [Streptomyces pseudovenezuelae]|uniref:Uncharacterized protein n=1 Tax=Streptomyces pseudovenezuelae TaxID=67350 RepID=A0ABT6LN76_9ACTN|nr:hypothetical protein [Streptomyces pseudovenezuelae]MDH6217405.1 hypothetical protein [Streptomyces pseudovenezuelae]